MRSLNLLKKYFFLLILLIISGCVEDPDPIRFAEPILDISVSDVTYNSAKLKFHLSNSRFSEIIIYIDRNSTFSNPSKHSIYNDGTVTITGCASATTYYVKAEITNDRVSSFSNTVSFKTANVSYSDLSANGTANCYIAKPNVEYSFKATVKGNSNESVGSPSSAEVLWESFGSNVKPNVGDVVKNVKYSNGRVRFTAGKEGNAVIAVKSSSGDILWSWHIWVTSADLEANRQIYTGGAVMMDRNLGALSATPGDYKALGLLYQWGRKDPFLGSSSISSSNKAQATVSEPSTVQSNSTTGTIDYVTKHPTTFVTNNSRNWDWYYTGNNSTDNTRWNSNKGIYDPCPPGWRVPDGGANGVWAKAGFPTSQTFDNTNKGMLFGSKYSQPSAWCPAAGYRWYGDGGLDNVGYYGYFWSCTPYSLYAYNLYFDNFGDVDPQGSYFRANVQSVRCQSE